MYQSTKLTLRLTEILFRVFYYMLTGEAHLVPTCKIGDR